MQVYGGKKIPYLVLFLLEQCVHNLLFLLHILLSFLESVALALDVDDGTVMQDTIENGQGNSHIGKHLSFLTKDMIQYFHDIEVVLDRPLQIIIQDLKGVSRFEALQVCL